MEVLIGWDEYIFTIINKGLSSPFLDGILVPIRHKLFWIPLYLFIITFINLNFRKERWMIFLFFGLTIFLSDTTSSKLIKKNVQRIRPCHVERLAPLSKVPCSYGFSFTSSHATNHFAIGTFLFFLFSFYKCRVLWLVWAGIIGFAQIYVGVHYPFDVLVGSLIGIIIGSITYHIYIRYINSVTNKAYVT